MFVLLAHLAKGAGVDGDCAGCLLRFTVSQDTWRHGQRRRAWCAGVFLRACSFSRLLLPHAHPFVPLNHTLPFELCGSCVAESAFLMQVMMEIRVGAFLLHGIVVK